MLTIVLSILVAVGKGPDAGRPSAVDARYEWRVYATCGEGALLYRAPLYPGRLAIVIDQGCQATHLDMDGRRLPFEPWRESDKSLALFAVPLEWLPGEQWLSVCHNQQCEPAPFDVAVAKYPESVIEVDKKFHKPPKEADDRIEADREKIRLAFASADFDAEEALNPARLSREPLWHKPFIKPCPPDYTSVFGAERVIKEKGNKRAEPKHTRHLGLDFDGKVGDPIIATNDGVIVLADDLYYSGNSVFLSHGHGLFSSYFHMSKLAVRTGQHIKRGDSLGLVGRTGRVTGPHLHFSAKLDGLYFDPVELFDLDLWLGDEH